MPDLDEEIRHGLERLTDPDAASDRPTFDTLVIRRRRRRIRNAGLAVVPIVLGAVVAGTVSLASDDGTTVAVGDDDDSSPPTTGRGVTVERTEVVGGDGGTARVVLEFDGPLPSRDIRHVEDISSPGVADAIVYTTQAAARVLVCENAHSFPPPAEGTVDVLIPADWFAEGEDTHTSELDTIANPAKFVVCGPHDGYFQYSIWGPVSADIADVGIEVDPDGSRLTIEIDSGSDTTATAPPELDQDDADAAASLVSEFLDDLRAGDRDAAAQRWTGYPELEFGASPAEKIRFIDRLLDDPSFSRVLGENTETFVTASWGWTSASPVVTVLAPRDGDSPPVAVAFLTGYSDEDNHPDSLRIHRLPQTDDPTAGGIAGSYAEPGQQIVIPGHPIEGDARAYIGGTEVPVDIDYQNVTMTITLPEDVDGDVAVTLSTATPELPGAQAFALTIDTR